MSDIALITWTSPKVEEAERIIRRLIDLHLIACASIFPVTSHFRWKGEIEKASEVKVFLKTRSEHFSKIEREILSNSSYEVPEILMFEARGCHEPYRQWVLGETS